MREARRGIIHFGRSLPIKWRRWLIFLLLTCALLMAAGFFVYEEYRTGSVSALLGLHPERPEVGSVVDELDGVKIYYNGPVGNVSGRNTAPCGYNLGQKYQCVEFIKRYYYEAKGHKMPNPWGHAKDFFQSGLPDGALNRDRGLLQFANGSATRPEAGDLLVMSGYHGHVGIISAVLDGKIELAQQNPGPDEPSRIWITLRNDSHNGEERWIVDSKRVLGWLRLP